MELSVGRARRCDAHHIITPSIDGPGGGNTPGAGKRLHEAGRNRNLGPPCHCHARRLHRKSPRCIPILPWPGSGHRKERYLLTRHERRIRLGTNRARNIWATSKASSSLRRWRNGTSTKTIEGMHDRSLSSTPRKPSLINPEANSPWGSGVRCKRLHHFLEAVVQLESPGLRPSRLASSAQTPDTSQCVGTPYGNETITEPGFAPCIAIINAAEATATGSHRHGSGRMNMREYRSIVFDELRVSAHPHVRFEIGNRLAVGPHNLEREQVQLSSNHRLRLIVNPNHPVPPGGQTGSSGIVAGDRPSLCIRKSNFTDGSLGKPAVVHDVAIHPVSPARQGGQRHLEKPRRRLLGMQMIDPIHRRPSHQKQMHQVPMIGDQIVELPQPQPPRIGEPHNAVRQRNLQGLVQTAAVSRRVLAPPDKAPCHKANITTAEAIAIAQVLFLSTVAPTMATRPTVRNTIIPNRKYPTPLLIRPHLQS